MGLLDKAKALQEVESKRTILEEKKKTLEHKKDVLKTDIVEKKTVQESQEEIKQRSYAAGAVIETDFDVLYRLVLDKNKVKISEIAKLFKIDKKKAEEWVQILDEHNLVRIYYPAMGEPEIRKITEHEKETKEQV